MAVARVCGLSMRTHSVLAAELEMWVRQSMQLAGVAYLARFVIAVEWHLLVQWH